MPTFPGSTGPLGGGQDPAATAATAAAQGGAQGGGQGGSTPQWPGQFTPIPPKQGVSLQLPGPMGAIINAFANIHTAKQNAAASDVNRQMVMMQAGWPLKPEGLQKSMKKAGFEMMSPDEMTKFLQGTADAQQAGQQAGGQAGGGQGRDPQTGLPLTGQEQPYPPSTRGMNPDQKAKVQAGTFIDGLVRQGIMNGRLRGMTEESQLKYAQSAAALKEKAINGDSEAMGTLYKMGEVKPPDMPVNAWLNADPATKQKMISMYAGAETDQQRAQRQTNIGTALLAEGIKPDLAYQAAPFLASGQPLPFAVQQQMPKQTPSDMLKEVDIMAKLTDMGFTGPMLQQYAHNANLAGGLDNIMPQGWQSIPQQMTALRGQELAAEQARTQTMNEQLHGYDVTGPDGRPIHIPGTLQMEYLKADATLKEMTARASSADARAELDKWTALADYAKATGHNLPPEIVDAANQKLANALGFSLEDVKNGWNWATGIPLIGGWLEKKGVGTSKQATPLPQAAPAAPGQPSAAAQAAQGAARTGGGGGGAGSTTIPEPVAPARPKAPAGSVPGSYKGKPVMINPATGEAYDTQSGQYVGNIKTGGVDAGPVDAGPGGSAGARQ